MRSNIRIQELLILIAVRLLVSNKDNPSRGIYIALNSLTVVLQNPIRRGKRMVITEKHCTPCEGGTPFTNDTEDEYLKMTPEWEIERLFEHKMRKVFFLKTFMNAIDLVNKIAAIAEAEGHHPELRINYTKVTVEIYTHAMLGLSENDFILAAKIDALMK